MAAILFSSVAHSQNIEESGYYALHPELGGTVTILKSEKSVLGKQGITTFTISAPSEGLYYASFWMLPTKSANGSYKSYRISVNGKNINDILKPSTDGWQSVSPLHATRLPIKKGENAISIIGNIPDIPAVEHLKLSTNKDAALIVSEQYAKYKSAAEHQTTLLKAGSSASENIITDTLAMLGAKPLTASNTPTYDFTYTLNMTVRYTFYRQVYFTQGQHVIITAKAKNNKGSILELFSATDPENYTWNTSSNATSKLNITIPKSDIYYVRVRSNLNAGYYNCDVNINDSIICNNVQIFSIGIPKTMTADKTYDSFTCYSTNGNPMMWVEDTGSPYGKISGYNDDYGVHGDFNWGVNARIHKKFSRDMKAILFSTAYSYFPEMKCDVYVGGESQDLTNSSYGSGTVNLTQLFPNLNVADAMQSAPYNNVYNCIAWSGGLCNTWAWPPSNISGDYDDLKKFDLFYTSERYAGCPKFTRQGATADNSVIDLWAIVNSDGTKSYTHASVRRGADSNAHGYDWESKLGALCRLYHQRDALHGSSYGQIVEHYRLISTAAKTFDESVAEGLTVIEYNSFTESEKQVIAAHLSKLGSAGISRFAKLYAAWAKVWNSSVYSNPDMIAACDEYKNLLSLCTSDGEYIYAVYAKLADNDICAVKLFQDIIKGGSNEVISKATKFIEDNKTNEAGAFIFRTPQSKSIIIAKALLAQEIGDSNSLKKGKAFSSDVDFALNNAGNTIQLSFTLSDRAVVSAVVVDAYGNVVANLLDNTSLSSGSHQYEYAPQRGGIYFVRLTVDGKTNVRKISIQ